MYAPKRTKYRKQQKGRARAVESNRSSVSFGKYAIKSLGNCRLKSSTIEAARRAIRRKLRRTGQVWICVYPDLSFTAKPLEVRMGKGKGSPDYWACRIKVGQILFQMDGMNPSLAKQAAQLASSKLPVKTTFFQVENGNMTH